jgi:hypothetical protein
MVNADSYQSAKLVGVFVVFTNFLQAKLGYRFKAARVFSDFFETSAFIIVTVDVATN